MDLIQNSDSSSSEEIVADLPTTSEEIIADLPTTSEEILVSDDVSAKYTEEIVAYEHDDESEAIMSSTLMIFMNCFETAMEKQRHIQERFDHKSIDSVPKLRTYLKIEVHASKIYTHALFELVQTEIFVGAWFCQIERRRNFLAKLREKAKKKAMDKGKDTGKDVEEEPINLFSRPDGLYKLFVRVGILCRHIFCAFKNAGIEVISNQYILRRWTKNLIPATLRNKRNRYGEKNEIVENYASEATFIVNYCVHILSKDERRLSAFFEKLKLLKIDVEADCPNPPSKDKLDNLEELVGVPKQAEKTVNNPSLGNPKGRKKLLIKGGKEQTLEKNKKNKNACSLCGEIDGHNRRTCPKKYAVEDELDQPEVTREEDNLDQLEVTA
ncbi:protein FAR1-RELATED SEQUENCE 5 [Artemisia annua]|uniref:Protein FAR1-RELATED SEQUENCE 5 n=1 Tax=Artemisia annua TaxID=35608 RepID=A0A2U1PI65_ARTAN|nr:protein FAR1-RELATED SEQUENCE 5 [Artemisia annua]